MNDPRRDLESAARRGVTADGVDATGADLSGARLARLRADFVRLDRANLRQATLTGAGLSDCDLVGADLTGAYLNQSTLWQCRFHDAVAEETAFHHAHVTLGWFQRARLAGSRFDHAVLSEVTFAGADLRRASLRDVRGAGTDLTGADLRGADLSRADLTGADLRGARLDGAVFADAVLTDARFDGEPPATDTGPPPYTWEGLLHVLDSGDPDRARRWWRDRPPDRYRPGALSVTSWRNPKDLDPVTTLALLDEVLTTDDQFALHDAMDQLMRFGPDWDLSALVERFPPLLGRPRGPAIPDSSPRETADPGRRAAIRLGVLASSPGPAAEAALAGLEAARGGSADRRRRAAMGLAVAAARAGDLTALDGLLASANAGLRASACEGVADVVEEEYWWREHEGILTPWDVPAAVERVLAHADDPAPAVRKAVETVRKRYATWANAHSRNVRLADA
jgi:uncharacterized protein YjbI with pentapeptide repeats